MRTRCNFFVKRASQKKIPPTWIGLRVDIRLRSSSRRRRHSNIQRLIQKKPVFKMSVQDLTRAYLADIKDADVRRALEAASVVRRITRPILKAMLQDVPPDLYERLRTLPLVESRPDGLMLHDAVRRTIAAALQAADPITFREYGRAAWRQLRGE